MSDDEKFAGIDVDEMKKLLDSSVEKYLDTHNLLGFKQDMYAKIESELTMASHRVKKLKKTEHLRRMYAGMALKAILISQTMVEGDSIAYTEVDDLTTGAVNLADALVEKLNDENQLKQAQETYKNHNQVLRSALEEIQNIFKKLDPATNEEEKIMRIVEEALEEDRSNE